MDDVEEQILAYPHLPPEEQREIELYVESNPEWAPLLRDVRALESRSEFSTGTLGVRGLVATYVVVQRLHPEQVPAELQQAFRRLEARVEDDEALRDEVESARRRLAEAEESFSPIARFEELTGHSLKENPSAEKTDTAEQGSANELALPQIFERILEVPLVVRRLALAIVIVGVLYGGLFAVSTATQTSLERLAVVDGSDDVIENYTSTQTRSARTDLTTSSVDSLYVEALSSLQTARSTTLGLFPRYDQATLTRSKQLLGRVLEGVEAGSFLALESHFYLGKIALAQGNVERARRHFTTVVEGGGRKTKEAQRILGALEEGEAN